MAIAPYGNFPLAPVAAGGPPCYAALSYPNPANPVQVYVPGVNRKSFSNFSPKLGVQLHPSRDIMVYGSWSKGYKTGGWTTRLTNPQGNVAPGFQRGKGHHHRSGHQVQPARPPAATEHGRFHHRL
jgi:outer membrane receptor protein involved in Fe transport